MTTVSKLIWMPYPNLYICSIQAYLYALFKLIYSQFKHIYVLFKFIYTLYPNLYICSLQTYIYMLYRDILLSIPMNIGNYTFSNIYIYIYRYGGVSMEYWITCLTATSGQANSSSSLSIMFLFGQIFLEKV